MYFKLILTYSSLIYHSALPDASVDVVIAAQSFHWFANRASLEEFHRVLAPGGSFGMVWIIEDQSILWLKEMYEMIDILHKKSDAPLPHFEEWEKFFGDLSEHLFSTPEEYIGFDYSVTSSFDHAYKLLSSYSVIAGGSESQQNDFQKLFNEVTKRHFKDKEIPLDAIYFKVYMYWCAKEN